MNISITDVERAESEVLVKSPKPFLENKVYGAYRYASYIENYSNHSTYTEFFKKATEDEHYDLEVMYIEVIETRKYSKISKKFIPPHIMEQLTLAHWKKIIRSDIAQFYDFMESRKKK